MELSISASLSGLNAASISQNITAHNVANISTPSFSQKQTIQTEVFPVGTQVTSVRESSGNDLSKQMVDLQTNKNVYTANAKAIKMQDRMNGELLNLVG